MITQPPYIPPSANDLQHAYAGHLFRLRGFLPNNNAITPTENTFSLARYHVEAGQEVAVKGEFPSPPVLAHVGNTVMDIKSIRNPSTDMVRISLVVSRSVSNGRVSLIWPLKTLTSEQLLLVTTQKFDLRQTDGVPGGNLFVGFFQEEPSEVYIGELALQLCNMMWKDAVLHATIPENATSGLVLVVTQSNVYQSRQSVLIGKPAKTATALPTGR